MKDSLANLRHLPPSLFANISRLIVDRLGIDDQAFMRTLDIVDHIVPHTPYRLTEAPDVACDVAQHSSPHFCLVRQDERVTHAQDCDHPIAPRHVCLDGHWDKEEYIKVTNANILGGMGTFTINHREAIDIPVIQACDHSLAFYQAELIALGETVCFDSEQTLPLLSMDIGTTYEANYLMQANHGHGAYLEYHNEPHFWMPLSPDCQGFITLGREIEGKYFLTGFKIPFGYGVYLKPYGIHSDAHLIGEYLVVYTLAKDYSTVILKNPSEGLMPFRPIEADPALANPKTCKALWQAARTGQWQALNQLLDSEEGASLAAASDNAALREAAFNGQLAIVERLLQHDSVRRHITAVQNGALALASHNGHLDIVNYLLEFPQVRQEITAAENKALVWAAANGHLPVVDRLLQCTAVHETVALSDDEAFREAVKRNQLAVVDRLLQIDAVVSNITAFHNEALKKAVSHGHLDMVNRLLSFEAVLQTIALDCQHKELLWVIKNGHLPVVDRLLAIDCIGQNIDALDNELLRTAAENDHLAIVERLLELDRVQHNVAASSNAVLRIAAEKGHLTLLNRLLTFEAVQLQITACDNQALRMAAKNGHLAIVNRLLEFDAVEQDVASGYNEAFQQAVANGHTAVVERLLLCPVVLAFEQKYQFRHKLASLQASG